MKTKLPRRWRNYIDTEADSNLRKLSKYRVPKTVPNCKFLYTYSKMF